MLRTVLKDVASRCACKSTKPEHMGVDVDGLACPLHRPMVESCLEWGGGG
jgi:hypothetical protein